MIRFDPPNHQMPANTSTGGSHWARGSRLPAYVKVSVTVRASRERILATIELGLANSK